ncbi:hypothetical protein PC116_g26549 [Phytophthora cactorum]|nr:hypothetical protein PC116_g26549 [Phytophthora cactorum]
MEAKPRTGDSEQQEDEKAESTEGPRSSESETTRPEHNPEQITPDEMFAALVADMLDSPGIGQVEARRMTVKELFATAYNAIPIHKEALPEARKRFPTLTAADAAGLLALFDQFYVQKERTYSDWTVRATAIGHELLTTKWAFKEIIRKMSRHTIARCRFTDDQLKEPGAVVVTEADIQELEDLAKPFSSLEEMKQMAEKRLNLQKDAEATAQAAVTPQGSSALA